MLINNMKKKISKLLERSLPLTFPTALERITGLLRLQLGAGSATHESGSDLWRKRSIWVSISSFRVFLFFLMFWSEWWVYGKLGTSVASFASLCQILTVILLQGCCGGNLFHIVTLDLMFVRAEELLQIMTAVSA